MQCFQLFKPLFSKSYGFFRNRFVFNETEWVHFDVVMTLDHFYPEFYESGKCQGKSVDLILLLVILRNWCSALIIEWVILFDWLTMGMKLLFLVNNYFNAVWCLNWGLIIFFREVIGGAFYSVESIDAARVVYRNAWLPILYATVTWWSNGGGYENVLNEKPDGRLSVAVQDGGNLGLGTPRPDVTPPTAEEINR